MMMVRGDDDVDDDDICFAGWNLRSADHGLVLCHLLPHVAVLHRVCGHLLDLWSASLSLLHLLINDNLCTASYSIKCSRPKLLHIAVLQCYSQTTVK